MNPKIHSIQIVDIDHPLNDQSGLDLISRIFFKSNLDAGEYIFVRSVNVGLRELHEADVREKLIT